VAKLNIKNNMLNEEGTCEQEVGMYVEYVPSVDNRMIIPEESGMGKDQMYWSDEAKLWQIYKMEDGCIQLISEKSIGNLMLKGASGYRNLVSTLKRVCTLFANHPLAVSARCLGETDKSYPVVTRAFRDMEYISDVKWMKDKGFSIKEDAAWLASREFYEMNKRDEKKRKLFLHAMTLTHDNHVCGKLLFSKDGTKRDYDEFTATGAVYPIVTFQPGVKLIGGDGTKARPFKMSI